MSSRAAGPLAASPRAARAASSSTFLINHCRAEREGEAGGRGGGPGCFAAPSGAPPLQTVSILSSTGVGTGGGREAPPRRLRSAFAVFTGGGLGRGSRPAGPPAASTGLHGGGRRAGSARRGAAAAAQFGFAGVRPPGGRLCVRLKTFLGRSFSCACRSLVTWPPRARPGPRGSAGAGRPRCERARPSDLALVCRHVAPPGGPRSPPNHEGGSGPAPASAPASAPAPGAHPATQVRHGPRPLSGGRRTPESASLGFGPGRRRPQAITGNGGGVPGISIL